jgi:hypothetical protein
MRAAPIPARAARAITAPATRPAADPGTCVQTDPSRDWQQVIARSVAWGITAEVREVAADSRSARGAVSRQGPCLVCGAGRHCGGPVTIPC